MDGAVHKFWVQENDKVVSLLGIELASAFKESYHCLQDSIARRTLFHVIASYDTEDNESFEKGRRLSVPCFFEQWPLFRTFFQTKRNDFLSDKEK